MINYILWDTRAELFSLGQFTLRWNGLLLILAFMVGRQILITIYKKEDKPTKEVDILATWLLISAYLGARFGQAIFYQPQLWSRPLSIFFPFVFKPAFHFTGISGFSSHGAVLAMLCALWLYSRKKKQGQHYLQILDRISILVIWMAVPILIGSFLNSEIVGKPTGSATGVVLVRPVTKGILQLPCCIMRNPGGKNPLTLVIAKKDKEVAKRENGHHSIALYLFFKEGTPVETVDEFLLGDVKTYLYDMSQVVDEPGTEPLHYAVFKEPNGDYEARVRTIGIARYPVQLFESVSCLLLLIFLFWYWNQYKLNLPSGRIFGFCMTLFWSLRFAFESLKEDQASFIKEMALNKAQVLCIPLILSGVAVLALSYRKSVSSKQ
jgi:prolipoprotein diacylglyceryltransferase